VTHTSLRGPHKFLVVHPSSEPDKSSPGRAESWTSLRRAPAWRAAPRIPPLPFTGAEPNDAAVCEDGSYDSGGASVRARPWHDSVTGRAALDDRRISSKSAAVMP
jgi:hypothetical protein